MNSRSMSPAKRRSPSRENDEVDALAVEIVTRAILPKDALVDALHIASAAVSQVDYLLSWNCSHIANPMILPRVFRTLERIDAVLYLQQFCSSFSNDLHTKGHA